MTLKVDGWVIRAITHPIFLAQKSIILMLYRVRDFIYEEINKFLQLVKDESVGLRGWNGVTCIEILLKSNIVAFREMDPKTVIRGNFAKDLEQFRSFARIDARMMTAIEQ